MSNADWDYDAGMLQASMICPPPAEYGLGTEEGIWKEKLISMI